MGDRWYLKCRGCEEEHYWDENAREKDTAFLASLYSELSDLGQAYEALEKKLHANPMYNYFIIDERQILGAARFCHEHEGKCGHVGVGAFGGGRWTEQCSHWVVCEGCNSSHPCSGKNGHEGPHFYKR